MGASIDDNAILVHDLLFRFVRKQRFVGLRHGVPAHQIAQDIGHTEHSLLFVVDAAPDKSVKELAEALKMERSWISRVVKNLEARGLLLVRSDPTDKRSKLISLSAEGKTLLDSIEHFVTTLMRDSLHALDECEQDEFRKLLEKFADGLKAPHYPQHNASHPVAYQLGRISAGLGMYGENMLESNLSVTELHTFLILKERQGLESQISDIQQRLPFDMSTVSRTLQSFEKKGWISKVRHKTDKRSFAIHLSEKGNALISSYYARVKEIFRAALSSFQTNELQSFLSLYDKVSATLPSTEVKIDSMRALTSEVEQTEARSLLQKTAKQRHPLLTEEKIGLYSSGTMRGVLTIERSDKGKELFSLSYDGEAIEEDEFLSLLKIHLQDS